MYHERFTNIHDSTIEAVDETAPEIWNVPEDEAYSMLQELAEELAEIYDMSVPTVGYGAVEYYNGDDEYIGLPRVSLVSFLHEFRHHMQNHGRRAHHDTEEDARGWSISVFATAEPGYFETAWQEGRIMFMPDYEEVN